MKYIVLFILLANSAVASEQMIAFVDCSIIAKHSESNGNITKYYACKDRAVALRGKWESLSQEGNQYYKELGDLRYQKEDFGRVPKEYKTFTNCDSKGAEGNYNGYMTERETYQCDKEKVSLAGQWGEEYQGNWEYTTSLGDISTQPQWADVKKDMDFTSSFQKWCPTKFGYKLCGLVDEPKVDHGKPPEYQRATIN